MRIQLVATCLFGLEHLLGEEIEKLGYERISTINGRVTFLGDEEAVALFLSEKITFTDISDLVIRVTEESPEVKTPSLSDIEAADKWARLRIIELADK